MIILRKDIHIPVVVVKKKRGSCEVHVPDLGLTVTGYDYISAISNAIFYVSSIYYYNLDHNMELQFTRTYADVEKTLSKYPKNAFVTFLNITEN